MAKIVQIQVLHGDLFQYFQAFWGRLKQIFIQVETSAQLFGWHRMIGLYVRIFEEYLIHRIFLIQIFMDKRLKLWIKRFDFL